MQVLNAKPENVERESEVVAQSGRKGAVTISTNMAGRGGCSGCCLSMFFCRNLEAPCAVQLVGPFVERMGRVARHWRLDSGSAPPVLTDLPWSLLSTGTDILLGGNPDYMARLKLREMLMPEIVSQGEWVTLWCPAWLRPREAGLPFLVCKLRRSFRC